MRPKLKRAEFRAAIQDSLGLYTIIASRCNVSRRTVERLIKEMRERQRSTDQLILDELEQEKQRTQDKVESLIYSAILNDKDIDLAKWYAARKMKNRGYSDKLDIDQTGQQKVIIEMADAPDWL